MTNEKKLLLKYLLKEYKEQSINKSKINLKEAIGRPIYEIATEISKDWKSVNYAAEPYLSAMYSLETINDKYILDSGRSIVAHFLNNASSWKGQKAKAIKLELNKMIK